MGGPWSGDCDQELVRRTTAGDDLAFHELQDRYTNEAMRVVSNVVPHANADQRFDIVVQAFVEAWRAITRGQHKPEDNFKSYLLIVVISAAKAWHRKQIESVLAQMDKHEATVLRMYMEGKSLAEIGSVVGLTPPEVYKLLVNALSNFRQLWRQRGFPDFL